jgi:hypothetical protein
VLSINRFFFLSLGSVCFLIIPFFWVALVFDYRALENVMIQLSESYFVGYPIPELLGASQIDSTTSQVFRIKIFCSLFLLSYSLFFIGLYSVEENYRRVKLLFRGVSVPLFFVVAGFWIKFVNDDHIIMHHEKSELFYATCICLVVSIFLFAYSLRSKKRKSSKFKARLAENKSSKIDEIKSVEPPASSPAVSSPEGEGDEPPQTDAAEELNEDKPATKPTHENIQSGDLPGIPSNEPNTIIPPDDLDSTPDPDLEEQDAKIEEQNVKENITDTDSNDEVSSGLETLPESNDTVDANSNAAELTEKISGDKE